MKEYLVVSDTNSQVLLSTPDYEEALTLLQNVRMCGGAATIFQSLEA